MMINRIVPARTLIVEFVRIVFFGETGQDRLSSSLTIARFIPPLGVRPGRASLFKGLTVEAGHGNLLIAAQLRAGITGSGVGDTLTFRISVGPAIVDILPGTTLDLGITGLTAAAAAFVVTVILRSVAFRREVVAVIGRRIIVVASLCIESAAVLNATIFKGIEYDFCTTGFRLCQLNITAVRQQTVLRSFVRRSGVVIVCSICAFRSMTVLIVEVDRFQVTVIVNVDDCRTVSFDHRRVLCSIGVVETGKGLSGIGSTGRNLLIGRSAADFAALIVVSLLSYRCILAVGDFLFPDDDRVSRIRIGGPLAVKRRFFRQFQTGSRIYDRAAAVRDLIAVSDAALFILAALVPAIEGISGTGRDREFRYGILGQNELSRNIGSSAAGLAGDEAQPVGFYE